MASIDRIRNVVLVGHNGTGKTSLAEAILYRAGVVSRPGRVDQGTATLMRDEEKEWQQSLALATTTLDWNGYKLNLIDTPGYADFTGEALMGLAVADLAVFVIDGVAGVQSQDIALWRHADRMGLPRMIFVNKLDRDHSSFSRALAQVRDAFGSHADPVELPIGEESSFHGVADLLTDHAFLYDSGKAEKVPVPEDMAEAERAEHERLMEEVLEMDDELLEQYLEGVEPSPEQLERLLHDAMDAARVFPVLCGSATAPIGADYLADLICRVGPAPGDGPAASVYVGEGTMEVAPDPDGDQLAFVFKTTVDEFLGQISFFKVLSGTIKSDDILVNSRTGNKERLHNLFNLVGADQRQVKEVTAGDIAATTKLADTRTGDTLAPAGTPVEFVAPKLPGAVYGVAIKAANRSDEDRLATTLRRLTLEDRTLHVGYDDSIRQTILQGGGETHIQVALARINRAGVEVETDDIRVPYRETLAGRCEVEGKYKKQSGGHGQFGIAQVRFEPLDRDGGYEFESEISGGAIPRNLIPAVSAGIEEAMTRGGKYGFPMVDLRAVCFDGKYHSVDSSEMSFKMAGSLALREAIEKVGVNVLEPVSEIWVHVPSDHQGAVLGDLNSRRAQVLGTDAGGSHGLTTIHALVPTSEIMRYAINLRSMTSGTGSFETEHHSYQPLPAHMVDGLVTTDQEG